MDNTLFVQSFAHVKDVIVPLAPYLGIALAIGLVALILRPKT